MKIKFLFCIKQSIILILNFQNKNRPYLLLYCSFLMFCQSCDAGLIQGMII